MPDSLVYSDYWSGYNILGTSGFRHCSLNHGKLFSDKKNHINEIGNFRNQAKRDLRRFNGIPKSHFYLFLKECEWRFNNRDPVSQLKQLKQWVKNHLK